MHSTFIVLVSYLPKNDMVVISIPYKPTCAHTHTKEFTQSSDQVYPCSQSDLVEVRSTTKIQRPGVSHIESKQLPKNQTR